MLSSITGLSERISRVFFLHARVIKTRQIVRQMHKAYLHLTDGADSFQFSINIKNESLGLDRQFNFQRQTTESISCFLSRINTNLEKVTEKKKKRKKKAGNQQDNSEPSEISIDLLSNGSSVPKDKLCKDVLVCDNKLVLLICGVEYVIILNAPWINNLSLPTSIMAGFLVYPSKFEAKNFEKNKSSFSWYRSEKDRKGEWSKVEDGYCYTPSSDDIGFFLKFTCVPGNESIQGPPFEVISKYPVQAGPGHCPFETRHLFTREKTSWPGFRVVSYNILADLYADSDTARNDLYPYCPAYAIGIDYRKQLLSKEIVGYNADIMCLQEVDQKIYVNDLDPLLSYMNYKSVFSKKGGQVTEGLACFFHSSKFRLLNSQMICLAEELPVNPIFEDLWKKLKDNKKLVERFLGRTTGLLVTVLQSTCNSNEIFIVGNTHLYFHPNADHIRLLQAGMIIRYLEYIQSELEAKYPDSRTNLIMCGDFNSTPECGVFQLMTTKYVHDDLKDWSSNADEAIKGISLSHSFLLESACGTPPFTNYTVGFVGCLDYIFYQCNNLTVSQVIPFPLDEEVKEHTALPSVVFPSDHVALVCDLKLEDSRLHVLDI